MKEQEISISKLFLTRKETDKLLSVLRQNNGNEIDKKTNNDNLYLISKVFNYRVKWWGKE